MINYNSEEEKCFYNKVGKIIGWDFSKMKYKMVDDSNFQFPDEFFDIITARHTLFNIREVNRLLKKNGYFFTEQIDENDCLQLKKTFGRGQGYESQIRLRERIE